MFLKLFHGPCLTPNRQPKKFINDKGTQSKVRNRLDSAGYDCIISTTCLLNISKYSFLSLIDNQIELLIWLFDKSKNSKRYELYKLCIAYLETYKLHCTIFSAFNIRNFTLYSFFGGILLQNQNTKKVI